MSSCFKTKSPVLETGLVSRTGLCNPRETSRFAFRTTTKIPTRRWKNPSGMPEGLPSGRRLNESPRPKAGKWAFSQSIHPAEPSLNESPRPKVGKFGNLPSDYRCTGRASMKVPTRRRGNLGTPERVPAVDLAASMKVPTRKRGNRPAYFGSATLSSPQ